MKNEDQLVAGEGRNKPVEKDTRYIQGGSEHILRKEYIGLPKGTIVYPFQGPMDKVPHGVNLQVNYFDDKNDPHIVTVNSADLEEKKLKKFAQIIAGLEAHTGKKIDIRGIVGNRLFFHLCENVERLHKKELNELKLIRSIVNPSNDNDSLYNSATHYTTKRRGQ